MCSIHKHTYDSANFTCSIVDILENVFLFYTLQHWSHNLQQTDILKPTLKTNKIKLKLERNINVIVHFYAPNDARTYAAMLAAVYRDVSLAPLHLLHPVYIPSRSGAQLSRLSSARTPRPPPRRLLRVGSYILQLNCFFHTNLLFI